MPTLALALEDPEMAAALGPHATAVLSRAVGLVAENDARVDAAFFWEDGAGDGAGDGS